MTYRLLCARRLVYDYIRRCGLEDRKFRRKLRSDWQTGAKDTKMLTVSAEERERKRKTTTSA